MLITWDEFVNLGLVGRPIELEELGGGNARGKIKSINRKLNTISIDIMEAYRFDDPEDGIENIKDFSLEILLPSYDERFRSFDGWTFFHNNPTKGYELIYIYTKGSFEQISQPN